MNTFTFKAKKSSGQVVSGKVKAKSKNEVLYMLAAKKLEPIHIEFQKSIFNLGSGGSITVSTKHIVQFTRQVAFLVNAGVPILQALQIVKEISHSKPLRIVTSDLITNIEKGDTFAVALSGYPSIFSNMYVNIIEAGEVGGNLDIMLNRLAEYIEESEKLKSRVIKAMMYPGFVLCVSVIIFIIIMVQVVPKFTTMFSTSDAELPMMTQVLIKMSDLFRNNIIVLLIAGFFLPFCFIMYLRSSAGRPLKDQLLMLLPVIGPLTVKNSLARFSKTLACLLSGGVNMSDALKTSAFTSDNFFIEKSIQTVRNQVIKGKSVAESLKKEKVIPSLVANMVAIGEETGSTDATLEKVSEFYAEQVRTTASTISELIQPFLIAGLGVVIGFVVIALYLPIFKLPGVIGGT